jgi:hypothetical protein
MTSISRELAIELIGVYLTRNLKIADFFDGWPPGIYGRNCDSVWSIRLPPDINRVGGSRYIVVSKLTGEIVADQVVGE